MPTLLDSVIGSLTPEAASAIGGIMGLSPELTTQGLQIITPLLESGLARSTATPEGQESLMKLLPAAVNDDTVALLKDTVNSPQSSQLLDHFVDLALGRNQSTILKTIGNAIGINPGLLVGAGMPLLLNQLKKVSTEQNLDGAGVANLLQTESQAFMAQGGPTVDLIQDAWKKSDLVDSIRGRFSDEEMAAISGAPLAVIGLVMNASPSGYSGSVQELGAAAKVINEAEAAVSDISFVDLLPHWDDRQVQGAIKDNNNEQAIATIKAGMAALVAKTPEQAAGYREFLVALGTKVAEAAKEGGFLGFGGKLVSEQEAAALAAIKDAVGT